MIYLRAVGLVLLVLLALGIVIGIVLFVGAIGTMLGVVIVVAFCLIYLAGWLHQTVTDSVREWYHARSSRRR